MKEKFDLRNMEEYGSMEEILRIKESLLNYRWRFIWVLCGYVRR